MGNIITIGNRKGGVGKSTSVSSLGGLAAARGMKTLLVDMDSQANLTLNYLREIPEKTVVDMFGDPKRRLPRVKVKENLYLVPADSDLAGLENSEMGPEDRLILAEALEKIRDDYDLIIIDIPPDMGWCSINALSASDYLFVPMLADGKSLKGVDDIVRLCYKAAGSIRVSGIFFTMFDKRKNIARKYYEKVCGSYGSTVMQTTIRPCVKLAECAEELTDIASFDPKCNGTADYTALLDEMLAVIKGN